MDTLFSLPLVQLLFSLVIAWGLFAIILGVVHEAIVQIIAERGRFLRVQLTRILHDSANKINWATLIYSKSTIRLLTKDKTVQVSEIQPKVFATAIIKAIADSHIVAAAITKENAKGQTAAREYENEELNSLKMATRLLKKSDLIQLVEDSLKKAELESSKASTGDARDEGAIHQALVNDIAEWYVALMDRITNWYKKRTRLRLFILGFICAVIFNVNSITIAKFFFANPKARESVIAYYQQNQTRLDSLAHRYDTLRIDTTTNVPDSLAQIFRFKVNARIKDSLNAVTNVLKLDSLLKASNVPIGWSEANPYRYCNKLLEDYEFAVKPQQSFFCSPPQNFLQKTGFVIYVLFGSLITAFAGSMGAPFWFDTLKKFSSYKTR